MLINISHICYQKFQERLFHKPVNTCSIPWKWSGGNFSAQSNDKQTAKNLKKIFPALFTLQILRMMNGNHYSGLLQELQ